MIFGISYGPLISQMSLKNSKNHKHSKTFYGSKIRALLRELWTKHVVYNFWYFLWSFDIPMSLKNSKNHKHSKTFCGSKIGALLRELWTKTCYLQFLVFLKVL